MATGDATALSMLNVFTDFELSQLCSGNADAGSPAQSYVTPALFRKAVLGGDVTAEPVEVQAALATAKTVFDYAVSRANALKNNELRGYEVYADAEFLIQGHVCEIARYHLANHENQQLSGENGTVSNIQKKYQEAINFFKSKNGCYQCTQPVGAVDLNKEGNQYDALVSFPDQVFSTDFWYGDNS